MFKIKDTHQEGSFGTIVKAGFLNLLIGALALFLDIVLEIPPLPIKKTPACLIFLILIILYVGLLIWSTLVLVSAKKKNKLAQKGPYALVRHPMYVGIVLLVNPGLAIFFQSWALLEACLIIYFVWKHFARKEERQLIKSLGSEYKEYDQKVGCLFPRVC